MVDVYPPSISSERQKRTPPRAACFPSHLFDATFIERDSRLHEELDAMDWDILKCHGCSLISRVAAVIDSHKEGK